VGWYGVNPKLSNFVERFKDSGDVWLISTDGFWCNRKYTIHCVSVDGQKPELYVLGGGYAYPLTEFLNSSELEKRQNLGKELYTFIIRTAAYTKAFIAGIWVKEDSSETGAFLLQCFSSSQKKSQKITTTLDTTLKCL